MPTHKSLYHLWSAPGTSVYNVQGTLIGTTTAYKAIAHNGKCIGSIQIDTGDFEDPSVWISGHGIRTQDGIQWKVFGTEGQKYFATRGAMFQTNGG